MEALAYKNDKTLEQLLTKYPKLKNLIGSDTKEEFFNNRIKYGGSGCPAKFGFDKGYKSSYSKCIHSCKTCWENLFETYEW